jgi:hypothetical protein
MRRNSALRRSAPLERKTPLARTWIRRRPPRRLASVDSDPGYLAYVRSLRCVGIDLFPGHECSGPVEADHARNISGLTGMGRKESDATATPKCRWLHRQWTDNSGLFKGWDEVKRRVWTLARIAETRPGWEALPEDTREWWQEVSRSVTEARRARRRRAS